ncbi:MAG: hypothetical protein JJ896_02675 [Rhodothermales bacterium]|nr:hypothetical protein [Rhodothermales bacterium]MBO6778536.1 hypothetical protein [Rhodothermales bacterium]
MARLGLFLAAGLIASSALAQVPRTVGYQGYLTDQLGQPVPDGRYDVTFRLYDHPSEGESRWTETQTVVVSTGLFSALLGTVEELDLLFDRQYYLTIEPGEEPESERLPLAATPYSLTAGAITQGVAVTTLNGLQDEVELVGAEGIRVTTDQNQIVISGAGLTQDPGCSGDDCGGVSSEVGVLGQASAQDGRGVYGLAEAAAGPAVGVYGLSRSTEGRGLQAYANAKTGLTYGLLAEAASLEGIGAYGQSPSLGLLGLSTLRAGFGVGVRGRSMSEDGAGVEGLGPRLGLLGIASSTTDVSKGVEGRTPSVDGAGVHGTALSSAGQASGVFGEAASYAGFGVQGRAPTFGVRGIALAPSGRSHGVYGSAISLDGRGVHGLAPTYGVYGQADVYGVYGSSRDLERPDVAGVYGKALSPDGFGVHGVAPRIGVFGVADTTDGDAYGVWGRASTPIGIGVYGEADTTEGANFGVYGSSKSPEGTGVYGVADTTSGRNFGVFGETKSDAGIGVYGKASGQGFAGWFEGKTYSDSDLIVSGSGVFDSLIKAGGIFLIDHPLDPENKLLAHSFVESPDMMNIYTGTVETDADGFATVTMPDWFEALNKDIRYQLTVIGQFAQAIVAEEMQDLQFVIQTDKPSVKVSWQVTGVRQDRWAQENRFIVERDKAPESRGLFLHPSAYGLPSQRGMRPRRAVPIDLLGRPGLEFRR